MCREGTLPRSNPNAKLVCALEDDVRMGPVSESLTTNLAGLHSVEVLSPSNKISPILHGDSHQQWFKSMRLTDVQFGAIRC